MRAALLVAASTASFGAAVAFAACGSRTGDYEEDFSEDVQRICTNLCEKVVECRDPPLFETVDECRATCTIPSFMYDDSECGRTLRDFRECVGETQSCEEYLDTLEVHAEDFTCKEELDAYAALCVYAEGGG